MQLYQEIQNGFVVWDSAKPINDVRYPPNIGDLWDSQELLSIGLYAPAEADHVPAGYVSRGLTVQRIDGVVRYVHDLVVAPMPSLTMRQMRLGLKNIGGLSKDFILDVINTEIPAGTHRDDAIIWYEETSIVEWDHPMTQALMLLSGISEDQAVAMWLAAAKIPA